MQHSRRLPVRCGRAWQVVLLLVVCVHSAKASELASEVLEQVGIRHGVCVVLGLPEAGQASFATDLARGSELTFYFQSASVDEAAAVREAADEAGLLGNRVFVDMGNWSRVHLADNLAGAIVVSDTAANHVAESELLRVLHPGGKAILPDRQIVKPTPEGIDSWSHPYHGPDNNPQSTDQLATAPYLTQFLAEPLFCPMPQVSVAAGGRVFRAFGHIAHKANQNAMLNTLICVNGFNGTILWQRQLPEGFVIQRNTMIATSDTLYMADHRSCKLIDAATGQLRDEIVVPEGVGDGPVWKWMALVDGVLYALVGGQEVEVATERSDTPGMGHWPWGMWRGHDYAEPRTNLGFGRTFLAIDPKTKDILWSHHEDQYNVLGTLPMRRACTRATGTIDSIFFRAWGGTVRIDTRTGSTHHIVPMRPPCQDGVIISDGNLYWGPWMCGCELSLYGHIGLRSAGGFRFRPGLDETRLTSYPDAATVEPLDMQAGDWPAYLGGNARQATTRSRLPRHVVRKWSVRLPNGAFPTAPITAGGMVFLGDRNGALHAIRAVDGTVAWRTHTPGAIYFPPAVADGRLLVGSADGRVYAFEATTGRPLWTFLAAPADRWIPVYGKLMSTWPVAGGVVVEDGVVYAAAGIAHYDGTHVYALDAATGAVKWYNDTSGATSAKTGSGVSLQGPLGIRDQELRFLGGGVHEEARYDLATGRCLNEPFDLPRSYFHTAFGAYYPEYGRYMALDHTLPGGRRLVYDITYEGSVHGDLALLPSLPPGAVRPVKPLSRWGIQRRRGGQGEKPIWQAPSSQQLNSFVVSDDLLLAAGQTEADAETSSFICAVRMADGGMPWRHPVPGPVVQGGMAVDGSGTIYVTLENGQLLAFARPDAPVPVRP